MTLPIPTLADCVLFVGSILFHSVSGSVSAVFCSCRTQISAHHVMCWVSIRWMRRTSSFNAIISTKSHSLTVPTWTSHTCVTRTVAFVAGSLHPRRPVIPQSCSGLRNPHQPSCQCAPQPRTARCPAAPQAGRHDRDTRKQVTQRLPIVRVSIRWLGSALIQCTVRSSVYPA